MMPSDPTNPPLLEPAPITVMDEANSAPYAADSFFQGEDGLVSVWDFDVEAIIDFQTRLQLASLALVPPKWLSCLCCYPCLLRKNIRWETEAQHLALTRDGVHIVRDAHPTWCGLPCTKRQSESKTIPYNKITKCDVWEPSDTSVVCCCIRNTLPQLRIEVAPSIESRGKAEKVVLAGVKHPFAFRQAVFTMKHSEAPSINAKGFAPDQCPVDDSSKVLSERNHMIAMLLKKFPSELRDDNGHLRAEA